MSFTIIHLHVPVANLVMVLFLFHIVVLYDIYHHTSTCSCGQSLSWFYYFVLYVIYHHTSTCSCGQSCHVSINNIAVLYVIYHHTSTCSCGQSCHGSIPFPHSCLLCHLPSYIYMFLWPIFVMVLLLCPLCHLPSYIYMFLWPILAWFYAFVLNDIYHHTSTCSCSQSCHCSIPFRLLQFRFLFSGSACQMSFVEAPVCCAVHTHVSKC